MKKAVKDLEHGDKVDNVSEVLTVEANDKGLWPGSRLITWRERTQDGRDWSCLAGDTLVHTN